MSRAMTDEERAALARVLAREECIWSLYQVVSEPLSWTSLSGDSDEQVQLWRHRVLGELDRVLLEAWKARAAVGAAARERAEVGRARDVAIRGIAQEEKRLVSLSEARNNAVRRWEQRKVLKEKMNYLRGLPTREVLARQIREAEEGRVMVEAEMRRSRDKRQRVVRELRVLLQAMSGVAEASREKRPAVVAANHDQKRQRKRFGSEADGNHSAGAMSIVGMNTDHPNDKMIWRSGYDSPNEEDDTGVATTDGLANDAIVTEENSVVCAPDTALGLQSTSLDQVDRYHHSSEMDDADGQAGPEDGELSEDSVDHRLG